LKRRRRRLLSIGHSYAVTMNRRLAQEMARVGGDAWDVTAAAPKHFVGSNDLRPVHLERQDDEPCRVVPLNAYLTARVHAFVYGWGLRALVAERWDLVHCWEEPYILVGGQMAWWTPRGTPLVFRSAQSISKSYPFPFKQIEKYAIQRASGWLCCGRLVEQMLRGRPGYDRLPHARIPLGVDVNAFRPDRAAGEAILHKVGWDSKGAPVVGYLGRFTPEKGLDLLQRSLDRVRTPWRALFVGAGALLPSLRAWADRHGDRVRVCVDVTHDQVPAYLNAMDILCAPSQTTRSWKEQFGRMVVEAFASGVAVIGSDSGEIPYVLKDSGIVVSEKDEAGLTRAIEELLEDGKKREELGRRGLARAHDEFAWSVVARRYLQFFEAVLENPTSAGQGSS
jgi:glycosyltransferase involved in cell wall biosynthesis